MKGVTVTLTGHATSCPKPLYEFWILAPSATLYKLARSYGEDAGFSWDTSSLAPGAYRITVWVRDSSSRGVYGNGSGRWDAYNASLLYTISAGCPSVTESAWPGTSVSAGTSVTITAAAPGCKGPQYEFWILAPGAKLYTLKQSYGASNTLRWDTSGLPAGTYRINVWVKDSTSAGVYGNASGRWDAYNAGLTVRVN